MAPMPARKPTDDEEDGPHPLLALVDKGNLPRLPARPCTYLPGQTARERGFLADRMDGELYHELMDRGFRRSGTLFYTTDCGACRACVPLRVPVATFRPSKSQRRVARRNLDLTTTVRTPQCRESTFDLYRRYLAHRYPDQAGAESFAQFRESLYARVVTTREVVYALDGVPIAISLLDVCSRSVSAVYHFYDPDHRDRSLGVFSVLAEIEWTRSIGVPHYYLGYWVAGSRAMQYKADYGPHEVLRAGRWQRPSEA
jgi:leucyl-tRNA---protein transferase